MLFRSFESAFFVKAWATLGARYVVPALKLVDEEEVVETELGILDDTSGTADAADQPDEKRNSAPAEDDPEIIVLEADERLKLK